MTQALLCYISEKPWVTLHPPKGCMSSRIDLWAVHGRSERAEF